MRLSFNVAELIGKPSREGRLIVGQPEWLPDKNCWSGMIKLKEDGPPYRLEFQVVIEGGEQ